MEQAEALQDDFVSEEAQEIEAQEEVTEEATGEETEAEEAEVIEPEYVDVEYEGAKYNLPPELKEALLRQQDYTTKTQEVATQRQALEQQQREFQQAAEMQARNLQGHAQLASLQNQLAQYDGFDWNGYIAANPEESQQAYVNYQQLKDSAQTLGQQLQQQESQALQQQRELHDRQMEQGKAELARDIPNWGTETAQKITTHGESYGFTSNEMSQIGDPRMVKVLHDAMMYRNSLKQATAKPEVQAKPVSKVRGKSKGKPDINKMSTKEYFAWREKNTKTR